VFDLTNFILARDTPVPREKGNFSTYLTPDLPSKKPLFIPSPPASLPAMSSPLSETIESRLTDLCSAIAADPQIRSARDQAEAFLADEQAVGLYREMMTLGNQLQQLHRAGEQLDEAEVERFEELRTRGNNHASIQAFHQAQDTLQSVATAVNGFISKTLERGAVPTPEEVFQSGSCGEGCGCH
jgi:cell fate (sporulation/competence/biofilm development) regulator YlbF (YheA/YmcA/DUF963 family)